MGNRWAEVCCEQGCYVARVWGPRGGQVGSAMRAPTLSEAVSAVEERHPGVTWTRPRDESPALLWANLP